MVQIKITDDLFQLLEILPPKINKIISSSKDIQTVIEVVLDLGKMAEVRFEKKGIYLEESYITQEDIDYVVSKVGEFSGDNRAGITRTLHRISAIRNRHGKIIGLTCRVGRAAYGTIDIIKDVIESGKNILFLGPPGIGKTTKLREAARVLSEDFGKRVVVVDTSNEIAGDGDIPHPGIGRSRRMQVPSPDKQHAIMIEAVENHMPEVIIVDEIGTEAEAIAARTIAERGVQLIGTAHGNSLGNLLQNPTLSDLVGGIQSVILSDEEARRRHTQKAILERKAPPTFDILVEIKERDILMVYSDIAKTVDRILRGKIPEGETRIRQADGKVEVKECKITEMPELTPEEELEVSEQKPVTFIKIYPYAINRKRLERALRALEVSAVVATTIEEADFILTTKSKTRPGNKIVTDAEQREIPIHVIKSNTFSQMLKFLKYYFRVSLSPEEGEEAALREVEESISQVFTTKKPVDLEPQNAYIRRLQHQLVQKYNLESESIGEEPKRRLRIYPARNADVAGGPAR